MPNVDSITVLICTYNRARLLEETLAALCSADLPEGCAVEILVVDNNSTDGTSEVVRRVAPPTGWAVRYAVERRQGKSYALNHGLTLAHGDIIALTDDDVLPARDWVVRIVEHFRSADLTFVFGKVLPRWEVPPPPELVTPRACAVWGPLALIDYGDELITYEPESFAWKRFPVGANLAVRRHALQEIGGWRTDLGKVDNTLIAGEDHELCVRLYRSGLYRGLYDPLVAVRHFVPATRLTRQYFRQWFYWHGRTMARMMSEIYPDVDLARVPTIAGVPRFVYRQVCGQLLQWVQRAGRSDALALLIEEVKLVEYWGFFIERWFHRTPARRYAGARS